MAAREFWHPTNGQSPASDGRNILVAAVPQKLTDDLASKAAMLITMGCGKACPVVPGVERDDWPSRTQGDASTARRAPVFICRAPRGPVV
jgi:hypothetical protein